MNEKAFIVGPYWGVREDAKGTWVVIDAASYIPGRVRPLHPIPMSCEPSRFDKTMVEAEEQGLLGEREEFDGGYILLFTKPVWVNK